MNRHLEKAMWKSVWRLIGLLTFFIVIMILNTLKSIISMQSYDAVVMFINSNLFIFVAIALFHFISELLENYKSGKFAPPFEAIAGIFVAAFFIKFIGFLGTILNLKIFYYIQKIDVLIYVTVFFIIIVGEYIKYMPKES